MVSWLFSGAQGRRLPAVLPALLSSASTPFSNISFRSAWGQQAGKSWLSGDIPFTLFPSRQKTDQSHKPSEFSPLGGGNAGQLLFVDRVLSRGQTFLNPGRF